LLALILASIMVLLTMAAGAKIQFYSIGTAYVFVAIGYVSHIYDRPKPKKTIVYYYSDGTKTIGCLSEQESAKERV